MVHQETLKAYEMAGIEYVKTPHDIAEISFNNWIKQSGRDPIITVNRITRLLTKPNKKQQSEFLTWSEKRVGYDHVGNEFDQATNSIKALQIERQEIVYYQPYDPKFIDKLNDMADPVKIKYYVQRGTNRYSIGDYDDFRNGRYEQLLQLGKSNRYYLRELYPAEFDEPVVRRIEPKSSVTKT